MELKQLMLDMRAALRKKDYTELHNLVEGTLQTITKEETDAMERQGKLQWEGPLLDQEEIIKVLSEPGVQSIQINLVLEHLYRINGIGFRVEGLSNEVNVADKTAGIIDVTDKVLDEVCYEAFQDWFNTEMSWDDEKTITDSWALVALFGLYPDQRLLNLVLSDRIILNLQPVERDRIFGNWDAFVAERFEALQERDMVDEVESSDS